MAYFNYFSCTSSDIINYYHGAEASDFATNSISGSDVILAELDYSEQLVLEALPLGFSTVLQNGIPYVLVADGYNLGMTGVTLSDLHSITKIDHTGTELPKIGGCGGSYSCGNLEALYEDTATVSISGSGIVTINPADSTKDYYAKVTFSDTTVFGSLKRLVRDLTACRLGSQLYSRGSEDEWVAVKRACEDSATLLQQIKDDPYWMPYELKKLKFYPGTSPVKVKGGISTIRLGRA
jgi:hypothetical protein